MSFAHPLSPFQAFCVLLAVQAADEEATPATATTAATATTTATATTATATTATATAAAAAAAAAAAESPFSPRRPVVSRRPSDGASSSSSSPYAVYSSPRASPHSAGDNQRAFEALWWERPALVILGLGFGLA